MKLKQVKLPTATESGLFVARALFKDDVSFWSLIMRWTSKYEKTICLMVPDKRARGGDSRAVDNGPLARDSSAPSGNLHD